jgi:hypothetical protein
MYPYSLILWRKLAVIYMYIGVSTLLELFSKQVPKYFWQVKWRNPEL